ncbi:hypothetical protein CBM2609_A140009 [Cupriavidus taiwanensis]|nr:hypothetical protein CBM2604_A120009 [Cupriavidus taiwanensis]SOZ25284.1 hypothetical protein CBM2609_A140009 [Cupriavidus taiwanensis]SOZ44535.1 hypothetical protein CBM2610_A150009 [Cupriavidus taiwanensis]
MGDDRLPLETSAISEVFLCAREVHHSRSLLYDHPPNRGWENAGRQNKILCYVGFQPGIALPDWRNGCQSDAVVCSFAGYKYKHVFGK